VALIQFIKNMVRSGIIVFRPRRNAFLALMLVAATRRTVDGYHPAEYERPRAEQTSASKAADLSRMISDLADLNVESHDLDTHCIDHLFKSGKFCDRNGAPVS
jgi:hypothetical protein